MSKAMAPLLAVWLISLPAIAEEPLRVLDAWARASVLVSRPGAAYVTIESVADDRLLSVATPLADAVVIHAIEKGEGVARMEHLDALDIPAGQRIVLAPGAMHLMLMGLQGKLREGTTFPMTLRFEKAGAVTVEVSVLGIAAAGPPGAAQ